MKSIENNKITFRTLQNWKKNRPEQLSNEIKPKRAARQFVSYAFGALDDLSIDAVCESLDVRI